MSLTYLIISSSGVLTKFPTDSVKRRLRQRADYWESIPLLAPYLELNCKIVEIDRSVMLILIGG